MTDRSIDYEMIDILKECCISSKENPNLSTQKLKSLDNKKLKIKNYKINSNQDKIVFSNLLIKNTLKEPQTEKLKKIKLLKDTPKIKMNNLFFANLRKLKADLFSSSPEKHNQVYSDSTNVNFPYETKIYNYDSFKSFFIKDNKNELPSNLITAVEQKSKKSLMNNTEYKEKYLFSEKKINVVNLDSKKIPEKTKIFLALERNLTNNSNYVYFLNFTDSNNSNILHRYNSSSRKIFFNNKSKKRNNYRINSAKKYTFSSLRELYRNIKIIKRDFSLSNKNIKLKKHKLIKKKKINDNENLKQLNIKKKSLLWKAKIERSINLISLNEYNKKNQFNKKSNKIINNYEVKKQFKNSAKKNHLSNYKLNDNCDKVILAKKLKNRTNINISTLCELRKKKKRENILENGN